VRLEIAEGESTNGPRAITVVEAVSNNNRGESLFLRLNVLRVNRCRDRRGSN
jgi:hypothetical protein